MEASEQLETERQLVLQLTNLIQSLERVISASPSSSSSLPARRLQLYKSLLCQLSPLLPTFSASSQPNSALSTSSTTTSSSFPSPTFGPQYTDASVNFSDNTKISNSARVKLNVGGRIFVTTVTTLTQERSMLQAMFSGRFTTITDENGEYFIDRDPKHFGTILNYLRSGNLVTEGLAATELAELKNEILFYQLDSLLEQEKDFADIYNKNPLTSWSQTYKSRYIEIGGTDNRTAWPIGGTYNVVTVDGYVSSGTYDWFIRIDRWDYMGIGLVSKSLLNYEQEFHKLFGCCVLYHGREFYYNYPDPIQSEIRTAFKGGDIIHIHLDLDGGMIQFYINNEETPRCECKFKNEIGQGSSGLAGGSGSSGSGGGGHKYELKLGCLLKGNAQVTILNCMMNDEGGKKLK